jgi:hypothetical protein
MSPTNQFQVAKNSRNVRKVNQTKSTIKATLNQLEATSSYGDIGRKHSVSKKHFYKAGNHPTRVITVIIQKYTLPRVSQICQKIQTTPNLPKLGGMTITAI